MVHSLARYLLLIFLAATALALPGSGGWSGAVAAGDRLASQHRLLSALGQYEIAIRFESGVPIARVRLAQTHLRRGQWREAAELFHAAEGEGAVSREVLLGLATALHRLGDVGGSIAALQRELASRPGDLEAWTTLVERAARSGLGPTEIVGLLGGQLGALPASGIALDQKVAYLLGSCVLDPASPEGTEALQAATRGVDRRMAAMAHELLLAAESAGDKDGGLASLAGTLLAQDLYGPALAYLEQAGEESGADADAWALRGYALMRLGRLDRAEEALRKSLEMAPGRPLEESLMGSFLRSRGDIEGAVRLLGRAAEREPDNPAVLAELASALFDLGDYGAGELALRQAVEAAPDNGELRLAVAGFYVDRQYRVERALSDAEDAVRLTGRTPASLSTWGWALHLAGRPEEALSPLLEAVSQNPESPQLRYRLGSVYEALRRRDLARDQYLLVGELDGSGEQWRRAKEALAQLGGT